MKGAVKGITSKKNQAKKQTEYVISTNLYRSGVCQKKRSKKLSDFRGVLGRSGRIRTCDPCVPNAVLYRAEPHSD
jgi:hypothetical protein